MPEDLKEPINKFEKSPTFIIPDLGYEMGEIERVAKKYSSDNHKEFMKKFLERAKESQLVDLTEEIWSQLENTDSYDVEKGDWSVVESNAEQVGREWKSKKEAIKNGIPMPAAIIMKIGNLYHKVAGNTRLMIYRAMGVTPKVLIVEME